MGSFFSSVFSRLGGGKKERRLLLLGLDAAGKSTLLYRLAIGEVVSTTPTIGFNVESVQYKNVSMTVFDIGGTSLCMASRRVVR